MPDNPTYASLITRLITGGANDRNAVVAHLCSHPADAHAVEAAVRDYLRSKLGWTRLVAADAVLRIYGDPHAVVPSVAAVLRAGGVAWSSADAFTLLRAIGERVARLGGPGAWKKLLDASPVEATPALLIALAKVAPDADRDFTHLCPAIRALFAGPSLRVAAGAALWRVTWRINREWLASINPTGDNLALPGLRHIVVDVLLEHLGRRPDLAPLVRDLVSGFSGDAGCVPVSQLARLGSRGWGVLVPMLSGGGRVPVPIAVRKAILDKAATQPAVLPLVHHHAHAVIAGAAAEGATNDLVPYAAEVLAKLGPAAGMALPDILNLMVRVPSTESVVGPVVRPIAPGFPNPSGTIVRALNRLRTAAYYGPDHAAAFTALADTLAALDLDAGPDLAENSGIDPRVPDLLLQQPGWRDAAPEVRLRHARTLADSVGSPRPEVRLRAAELLRHYRGELPAVWPVLVAVLTCSDEKTVCGVLPHFRHLEPVADVVTLELLSLFREKNPAYAARAVVALWRLGRFPEVAVALRAAVEVSAEDGWGWAVLRGVVGRLASAHVLIGGLSELFAAAPAAIAEKVAALLNAPESPEESRITACLPRPGEPGGVNWDGLHKIIESDGAVGAMLFVALMCEYGSAGFRNQKLWMIKCHRELTRVGLSESKVAIEGIVNTLSMSGPLGADRCAAVRSFFCGRTELPPEVVKLLEHRLGWFRWAGLELADGWSLTPEEVRALTADRVWDTNPHVRERALRLVRG
jgi:hypothetical protein